MEAPARPDSEKQVPPWLHGIRTGSLVEVREGRERQLVSITPPVPTNRVWVVEPFLVPVDSSHSVKSLAGYAMKERKSGGLEVRGTRR